MEISYKRVSIMLLLMLTLIISPILISDSNTVHAAKQDDIAKIAKSKKGKRASHFRGFTNGRWCSQFVWWSAKKAGLMNGKTLPKKSLGGTNDIQRYYTKKGQYKKATKRLKVKKGDLAIFGSSTHIGIVTKVKGRNVWVTHGNWSNKVCITRIKKTGYDSKARARIKGYVRLDYLASEPNVDIIFDANGGSVDVESKTVKNTTQIGVLPEPEKESAQFKGWYTKPDGGKQITENYKVDVKEELTVYAQYSEAV